MSGDFSKEVSMERFVSRKSAEEVMVVDTVKRRETVADFFVCFKLPVVMGASSGAENRN